MTEEREGLLPILDVEIDLPAGQSVSNSVARGIAEAAGEILGVERSRTWVRMRPLPVDREAKGAEDHSAEAHPVFVTVWRLSSPGPRLLRDQAEALARAVADVCKRPVEDVHVLFEPSPARSPPRAD